MGTSLLAGCAIDAHAFALRLYEADAPLYECGEYSDTVYLVLFGQVLVEKHHLESAAFAEVFGENEAVGLDAALGISQRSESAFTTTTTLVAVIPRHILKILISFEPRLALNVARIMHERLASVRAILR